MKASKRGYAEKGRKMKISVQGLSSLLITENGNVLKQRENVD